MNDDKDNNSFLNGLPVKKIIGLLVAWIILWDYVLSPALNWLWPSLHAPGGDPVALLQTIIGAVFQ